jgi:hypothetical protein
MAYENPILNKTFTYAIPDEWRSTSFSQGKTSTWTYRGPRYLTFEIDKETGKETGWCLTTERELQRPVPLNCERVTVDCTNDKYTLLCDIANDIGDPEAVKFRSNRIWEVLHQPPEGYTPTYYTKVYEPRDIYDEFNITYNFQTKEFNIPVKGWETEGRTDLTWDDIKEVRDQMLEGSDGKISEDMPDALKEQWKKYRQLLRDLPTALAGFEPWIAAKMLPPSPDAPPIQNPTESMGL